MNNFNDQKTDDIKYINFTRNMISSYVDDEHQDKSGGYQISDAQQEIHLSGNSWKKIAYNYEITKNTVLEFDIRVDSVGELQGIVLETDDTYHSGSKVIQLAGTQNHWRFDKSHQYAGDGEYQTFRIKAEDYVKSGTSLKSIGLINDDDVDGSALTSFRNISLHEGALDTGVKTREGYAVFDEYKVDSYVASEKQDKDGDFRIGRNGREIELSGNTWKKIEINDTEITKDTILEFDVRIDQVGELQGIILETDDTYHTGGKVIKLSGSQDHWRFDETHQYDGNGQYQTFRIKASDYVDVGATVKYVGLINDDDVDGSGEISFKNIRIHDTTSAEKDKQNDKEQQDKDNKKNPDKAPVDKGDQKPQQPEKNDQKDKDDKLDDGASKEEKDNQNNENPSQSGKSSYNAHSDQFDVMGGRVTILDVTKNDDFAGDIHSLSIGDFPEYGNVSVNPDGTLALVLSEVPEYAGDLSFTYQLTDDAGNVSTGNVDLNVNQSPQEHGWGLGNHWALQTDDNGLSIVEPGENHRKIYVSGGDHALSKADIAEREGLNVSDITRWWLEDNPQYGGSEELALDTKTGMSVWYHTSSFDINSNWLMFERGYEYDGLNRMHPRGGRGESELHPMMITSYGEGDLPVLNGEIFGFQNPHFDNVLFKDLNIQKGITFLDGGDAFFENLTLEGDGFVAQTLESLTIRHLNIYDAVTDHKDDDEPWAAHRDRKQGVYISGADDLLIEGNVVDHSAWEEGYDPKGSADSGQPPSMYSHNFYLQVGNQDVTFRDNITMRGASFGVQVRSGGFIENNVILDNNIGINFLGNEGNYTLFMDNVLTSGAHKEANNIGGLTMGAHNGGALSALVGNIITHMADPNNPDEIAEKRITHRPLEHWKAPSYDDTIIYNWGTSDDVNVDGLDKFKLDQTTIQQLAGQLLGKDSASIDEFADYLRERSDANWDDVADATLINGFFRNGFGIETELREDATILRFVPNELGAGVRWDNKLNWNTQDLPGTVDGDSVDLGGNKVNYSGTNKIETLEFGAHGELKVHQGYLNIANDIIVSEKGAGMDIRFSGQFWTNSYTSNAGMLDIDISGGRFANTGDFSGLFNIHVKGQQATKFGVEGDSEILLGAADESRFVIDTGSTLTIDGDRVKIGFDGQHGGESLFALNGGGKLSFVFDDAAISTIREFRSGHYGTEQPDVTSVADLGDGTATLELNLVNLDTKNGVHTFDLIKVDELNGGFGDISVLGIGQNGLKGVRLGVDYQNDTVYADLAVNDQSYRGVSLDFYGSDDLDIFTLLSDQSVTQDIHDFSQGDKIDLSGIISGDSALDTAIADFVKIEADSDNTSELKIDVDGSGNNFIKLATIHHSDALASLEDIVTTRASDVI